MGSLRPTEFDLPGENYEGFLSRKSWARIDTGRVTYFLGKDEMGENMNFGRMEMAGESGKGSFVPNHKDAADPAIAREAAADARAINDVLNSSGPRKAYERMLSEVQQAKEKGKNDPEYLADYKDQLSRQLYKQGLLPALSVEWAGRVPDRNELRYEKVDPLTHVLLKQSEK